MKNLTFIFYIFIVIPLFSFAQENSTFLVVEIFCDTCENGKCDTIVYKSTNNPKECIFRRDTLLSTLKFVLEPDGYFVNECSRTLIDSSGKMKRYKVTYGDGDTRFVEIISKEDCNVEKTYSEENELTLSDSTIFKNKMRYERHFTNYNHNQVSSYMKDQYFYHINKKLKKIIRTSSRGHVRWVYCYNIKGRIVERKHYQRQREEDEWSLSDESKYKYFGKYISKEIEKDLFRNSIIYRESYRLTDSKEYYLKTITREGCTKKIYTSIRL